MIGMLPTEKEELSVVERFRESHHAVAMMFAAGMTPSMIRQKTGYSTRRLTLIYNNPAFQDLIKIKAKRIEERWEEKIDAFTDLGLTNMIAAERQLHDKIAQADDEGEFLPTRDLISIVADRADRFGYSKHSVVKHEHDFAAALDRAIARSGVKQIEGKAEDLTLPLPAPSEAPVEESHPPSRREPSLSTIEGMKRRKL